MSVRLYCMSVRLYCMSVRLYCMSVRLFVFLLQAILVRDYREECRKLVEDVSLLYNSPKCNK